MSPELKEFKTWALSFSAKDRAALAEHLIASLDSLEDSENERLWLEEADRRYKEYKKGNVSARPAEDVLRDARSIIK